MDTIDLDRCTVEELAYWFWQLRGSPIGSPDQDWDRAEKELRLEPLAAWLPLEALGLERRASRARPAQQGAR